MKFFNIDLEEALTSVREHTCANCGAKIGDTQVQTHKMRCKKGFNKQTIQLAR